MKKDTKKKQNNKRWRETRVLQYSVYRSVRHEHIFITNSFWALHKSRLSSLLCCSPKCSALFASDTDITLSTTQHTNSTHTRRHSYQTQAGSYFEFLNNLIFFSSFFCFNVNFADFYRHGTKGTNHTLAILDVMYCVCASFVAVVVFVDFFIFATRSCFYAMLRFILCSFHITSTQKKPIKAQRREICLARKTQTKFQRAFNVWTRAYQQTICIRETTPRLAFMVFFSALQQIKWFLYIFEI